MGRTFAGADLVKATGGNVFGGDRVACSFGCWLNGSGQQDKIIMMDGRNLSTGFCRFGTENAVGGTKCRAVISGGSGTTRLDSTSTAVIADSAWHHVLFTLTSAGNWVLYIDGSSDSSGGPLTADAFSTTWMALGCLARNTNAQFFTGSIAHAANWSVALTAGQAKLLASGASPLHLAPAHYWPLWGLDSPEPDLGVSTHATGTLTSTAFTPGKDAASLLHLGGSLVA